ncbi:MAG: hypothetical protein M3Q79_03195 [bacterium]|nr:hypothetical protein [bacterium]
MLKKNNQRPYCGLDDLLSQIEGSNGLACKKIYADYKHLFETAPGASHNHQTWPGGYADHIADAMNIVSIIFDTLDNVRPLVFSKSDALLVIFLHDLEKPFRYSYDNNGNILADPKLSNKSAKSNKRLDVISRYNIQLNEQQTNALRYVEGVRESEYSPGARTMGELASLCHCADTLSARLWYNHPLPEGKDTWEGSTRANSLASDIVLSSELKK